MAGQSIVKQISANPKRIDVDKLGADQDSVGLPGPGNLNNISGQSSGFDGMVMGLKIEL
jgi:hypothetical protein